MFINFHRQGAIGLKGNGPHESSAALASNANPRIATLMQVNRKKTKKKKVLYVGFIMGPDPG